MKGRGRKNPRVTAYLKSIHSGAQRTQKEYSERDKVKKALVQILNNQIELLAHNETVHHKTRQRIERETSEIIEALKWSLGL